MCLVALAWKSHPRWRLLMAGNRDEFHARPTAPLQRWQLHGGDILAGRDLRSGGTWMGLGQDGRAAVVTNVRDPLASSSGPSRGRLVADYVGGSLPADVHAGELETVAARYPPFNLLLADARQCRFLGNHPAQSQALAAGVHVVSNGPPDAPWPKCEHLRAVLEHWLGSDGNCFDPLWQALADETLAADRELPDTGIDLELERQLSPAFIRGHDYGTRASTLLAVDHAGHGWIHERRFGPDGAFLGHTRLQI